MIKSSSFRILLALLLPAFFVLSACDSGGSNGEEALNNEFSFTITPTSSSNSNAAVPKIEQKDLDGFSFFVDTDDIEDVEEQAFVIYFSGGEDFSQQSASQGLFGFLARQSSQPGTSTYNLTDGSTGEPSPSDFMGFLFENAENMAAQDTPYYVFQSGSVTITESSDNEVAGSVSASAIGYTFTGTEYTEETVEITGEFTAENLDTYVPFGQYTETPAE